MSPESVTNVLTALRIVLAVLFVVAGISHFAPAVQRTMSAMIPPRLRVRGLLLTGVLAPIAVFGIAFWLGRRREAGPQALMLLAGLALVSAISLDIFVFGLGSLIV